MNRIILSITLLISSVPYTKLLSNTSFICPCVNSKNNTACCCIDNNNRCNCAAMFETIGSIPSTCSCEKINTTQRIDTPYIEVSHGELFDKVTILEIKSEQIADQKKLNNVATELNKLNKVLCTVLENNPSEKDFLLSLKNDLTTVNWEMWQVEDAIREKEATKEFDEEFITLARSVYLLNDLRCSIKRRISETLSSHIIEEKSYATSEE